MSGLWGGRFTGDIDSAMFRLSKSTDIDWRLAPYDLAASIAHLHALTNGGLIKSESAAKIEIALRQLLSEVISGDFTPDSEDEDVHAALERGLSAKVGELGGLIRAGRSRNDQVATDLKLLMLHDFSELAALIWDLANALMDKASKYVDLVAPGFTHLQHAQPVSFGQELAKHAVALGRDLDRISDWYHRTNISPLGAGALSGSSLPINPIATAKELGFSGIVENSIDAVGDRDFVAEGLFILALLGVHLSRIGEEWTIWATPEFGWAELADGFSTGSSIMPQKKNPDVAELTRGKVGRMIGDLTGLLATLKALPLAYNRDLQEDKEPVFDISDSLQLILPAFTGMIATMTFNVERMEELSGQGFSLATDVAEWLVKNKVPFREAHEITGKLVAFAEARGVGLEELSDAEFISVSPMLTPDVREVLSVAGSIKSRTGAGGTSVARVLDQISALRRLVPQGSR